MLRNKIIICILFSGVFLYSAKITDYVSKNDARTANRIFIYKKPKTENVQNSSQNQKEKKTESSRPNEAVKKTQNSSAAQGASQNSAQPEKEAPKPIPVKDKIDEIELEYGNVREISEKLDGFQGYKMIGFDNRIIISGNESGIDEIKRVIKIMDKPKDQIIIKGTIIDTSSNLFERLGIDWSINSGNPASAKDNIIAKFLNGEISISSVFSSGKNLLGIDFNLLKENGDIRIEAMPTLLVMENEEGELKVTEEVLVGEKKTTKNNEEYVEPIFSEAGIVFKILPEVRKMNGNKKILLKIDTEISNFKLNSSYNDSTGAKQKNQTKTLITLDNGGSTFIGGLKQNVGKETVRRVPFFSKIPLIGPLFKYKRKNNEVRDIYIEIEAVIQEMKN